MAQQSVAVTTSAALLMQPPSGVTNGNVTVTLFNPPANGSTIYIGAGSGVGTTTGFPLTPGSEVTWYNPPSAGVYGLTSSGVVNLTVTSVIS